MEKNYIEWRIYRESRIHYT